MTESPTEVRIIEAGEYVLGVMAEAERMEFEQRLSQEPELAKQVKRWTEHFAAMSRRLDQEPVSPRVWARIDSSVGFGHAARTSVASTLAWLWKGWAVAASAAVVVLSVQMLGANQAVGSSPRYVAVMKSPDKTTEWLVDAMPNDIIRVYQIGKLPIEGNPASMGKTLQLWTKAPSDDAPMSLGLMELGKPMVVRTDNLPGIVEEQLFAVSLEPENGSPFDNKPSGPIMFAGNGVAIK